MTVPLTIKRCLQRAAMGAGGLLRWPAGRRARLGYFDPRPWQSFEPATIALVAAHWIGDTFWATQVVPALRERFGARPIFAITRPTCTDLWHGLLDSDHVLTTTAVISDRRRERVSWSLLRAQAREWRAREFDLVIDLMGNRYSAALTFLLRPACSLGFDGGELGWLYTHRVGDAERAGEHLRSRPFRVIEPLIGPAAVQRWLAQPLRPPVATRDPGQVAAELDLAGRQFAILAPGAGWPAKQWPAERFIEVGQRLTAAGWSCLISGAAAEDALCQRVAGEIGQSARTFVATKPIGELVALLSLAAGVVANDSGIAHLAAALGRPTAAVFTGATDERKCSPLGEKTKVFVTPVEASQIVEFLLAMEEGKSQIPNPKSQTNPKHQAPKGNNG